MKLDRNINPDGRGKYALINLRTNQVQWGGADGEQFFVLKYKDRFAAPALRAYAKACKDEAVKIRERGKSGLTATANKIAADLEEFAYDVEQEAKCAEKFGTKLPD